MYHLPLHLVTCSITGCVDDLTAILTDDDHEPIRLCGVHYRAALDGIAKLVVAERHVRRQRAWAADFALLSPMEQFDFDNR